MGKCHPPVLKLIPAATPEGFHFGDPQGHTRMEILSIYIVDDICVIGFLKDGEVSPTGSETHSSGNPRGLPFWGPTGAHQNGDSQHLYCGRHLCHWISEGWGSVTHRF